MGLRYCCEILRFSGFEYAYFVITRTIGVVGIDATLEEIENLLMNDQWGSVYAFLINNDGETIFHPLLRPSTEVRVVHINYTTCII